MAIDKTDSNYKYVHRNILMALSRFDGKIITSDISPGIAHMVIKHLLGSHTDRIITTDFFITQSLMEDPFLLNIKLPLKELSEKIPDGDHTEEAEKIIGEGLIRNFEKIPSLKDLQIPQELFLDLNLTVTDCASQINSVSLGVVKKAKVIMFNKELLTIVVVNSKEYPTQEFAKITMFEPYKRYGLIGNILKRKDINE